MGVGVTLWSDGSGKFLGGVIIEEEEIAKDVGDGCGDFLVSVLGSHAEDDEEMVEDCESAGDEGDLEYKIACICCRRLFIQLSKC